MSDIGTRIRERRKRLGWTATKLAVLAGINQGFLSKIENGKCSYTADTLQRISAALGVSPSYFFERGNLQMAIPDFRRIPVLKLTEVFGWKGVNSTAGDQTVRETIMTNLEHPADTFSIYLSDDSMMPHFSVGDLVVIDPTIQPKPGDFVVATEPNGEAAFRQYRDAGKNEAGKDVFELIPLNTLFAPMRSDRQSIEIVGVIVEHRRTYRRKS